MVILPVFHHRRAFTFAEAYGSGQANFLFPFFKISTKKLGSVVIYF
jgi:hypothetical protein